MVMLHLLKLNYPLFIYSLFIHSTQLFFVTGRYFLIIINIICQLSTTTTTTYTSNQCIFSSSVHRQCNMLSIIISTIHTALYNICISHGMKHPILNKVCIQIFLINKYTLRVLIYWKISYSQLLLWIIPLCINKLYFSTIRHNCIKLMIHKSTFIQHVS